MQGDGFMGLGTRGPTGWVLAAVLFFSQDFWTCVSGEVLTVLMSQIPTLLFNCHKTFSINLAWEQLLENDLVWI